MEEKQEMGYKERLYDAIEKIQCKKNEACSYDEMLEDILSRLEDMRRQQGTLFFIGNGGSAGIAMHMTTDFLKNGHVRTHGMHDPAMLTCLGNDYGYPYVFSKQLELVASPGDMLVAISSSGKSPKILEGVRVAREKGCHILALSGFEADNPLRGMGDSSIYVPSMEYGIVESVHNIILQQIVDLLMARDKEEGR